MANDPFKSPATGLVSIGDDTEETFIEVDIGNSLEADLNNSAELDLIVSILVDLSSLTFVDFTTTSVGNFTMLFTEDKTFEDRFSIELLLLTTNGWKVEDITIGAVDGDVIIIEETAVDVTDTLATETLVGDLLLGLAAIGE